MHKEGGAGRCAGTVFVCNNRILAQVRKVRVQAEPRESFQKSKNLLYIICNSICCSDRGV